MNAEVVKLKAAMAVFSAAFLSLACVYSPPGQTAARAPLAPYTAAIEIRATAKGHGAIIPAGCAVDPALGARIELRDSMGGTRLLVILKPSAALLFAPDNGESAAWNESDPSLPWSPLDLWTLLAAEPPPHRDFAKYDDSGRLMACSWTGASGGRRASFVRASGDFPYSSATMDGPIGAVLTIEWRKVALGAMPAQALVPPVGKGAGRVPASALLEGLLP